MADLSTNAFQNGKSFNLKRCPFCPTGKGELIRGEQGRDGYITRYVFVRCAVCKAGTRRVTYPATETFSEPYEQKAANLWNRRSA